MKSESINQTYFDLIYRLNLIIVIVKKIMQFSIVIMYKCEKFISLRIYVMIKPKSIKIDSKILKTM